jgi:F0F1-type ATP synthase membrane subunit b/b'
MKNLTYARLEEAGRISSPPGILALILPDLLELAERRMPKLERDIEKASQERMEAHRRQAQIEAAREEARLSSVVNALAAASSAILGLNSFQQQEKAAPGIRGQQENAAQGIDGKPSTSARG